MIAVLFDVDQTLVDARRSGSTAMKRVFEEAWGWPDATEGVSMAGRTDHAILVEIFSRQMKTGLLPTMIGDLQEQFVKRYLAALDAQLSITPAEPCPGVLELIGRLHHVTKAAPGLATGNLKKGAERKLRSAGIDPCWFAYGAFGDDHEDRADVVRQATMSAREHASKDVTVAVVGDTPLDLRAARSCGLPCALVATGSYSLAELDRLGADLALSSLADPDPLLRWLASLDA